jgi:hypothetical protein
VNANRAPSQAKINVASAKGLTITPSEYLIHDPQEVIVTTEDKLQLCLSKHLRKIEKRKGWITPLGILVAIIASLVTANFKDIGFIDATMWRAIFFIASLISGFWLLFSVREALFSEKLEDVIVELKKSSGSLTKLVKK